MMDSRHLTQDELQDECIKRFGPDPAKWAFRCPSCDDVAVAADFSPFTKSGFGSELLGQECIGRHLGALSYKTQEEWKASGGRGCDWAAYGLFHGPWFVKLPNGKEIPSFPLADPLKEATAQ